MLMVIMTKMKMTNGAITITLKLNKNHDRCATGALKNNHNDDIDRYI